MMYVGQIIMLYTLNVYSAACELYLNKTGGKNLIVKLRKSIHCGLDHGLGLVDKEEDRIL